jgi:hypothetical protein
MLHCMKRRDCKRNSNETCIFFQRYCTASSVPCMHATAAAVTGAMHHTCQLVDRLQQQPYRSCEQLQCPMHLRCAALHGPQTCTLACSPAHNSPAFAAAHDTMFRAEQHIHSLSHNDTPHTKHSSFSADLQAQHHFNPHAPTPQTHSPALHTPHHQPPAAGCSHCCSAAAAISSAFCLIHTQ